MSPDLKTISPNITDEHLHEIIRKKGGVRMTSWDFEGAAGKKGDYLLSEVFKVIVKGVDDKGTELDVHLIIKTTPKSIARKKTFRSSDFFRNEINFYNVVAKGFKDFQAVKTDAKYPFTEIATCLVSHLDGENDFLALESLNPQYESASRQESMNIGLCRLIMRTLGRFHGLSFVIRDQSPKLFDEMTQAVEETYYAQRLRPWYQGFMDNQIEVALDAVSKVYGGSVIEEKAKKFLTDGPLYEKMVKMTHTRNRYSVIGHGDCWIPNFLFHSTKLDGKSIPVSAKMIDFQLARYASPMVDISFFIYSCTDEACREQYFDDLIKNYHTSLCELIRDLGSNPDYLFPFSALESEMKTYFRFGVGMGIESVPFSMMDDEDTADMDQLTGDQAVPLTNIWIIKKLTKEQDLKRLADLFKHSVNRGFLD